MPAASQPRHRRASLLSVAIAAALALPAAAVAAPKWECPDGFAPRAGLNIDFPADGRKRAMGRLVRIPHCVRLVRLSARRAPRPGAAAVVRCLVYSSSIF